MTRLIRILLLVAALSAGLVSTAHSATTGGASPESGAAPAPPRAADGQIAMVSRTDHLLGRLVRFDGHAGGRGEGASITVERFDPLQNLWIAVVTATTGQDGVFAARWRADHIGVFRFRAVATPHGGAHAASASPEVALTVYKPAEATWYGPGFYGRQTACGQRMSKRLLGVAHKKLKCGTQVALFYKGRTITVPVVDRGPFRKNTDWDLTSATAEAVGFTGTGTIGAVRLRTR